MSPQLNTYYYGFNLRRAPFKDQAGLRRALSLVIDREKLAQLVLRVGRAARLWLGAAGDRRLYLAVVRLPRLADAPRASPRRSGSTAAAGYSRDKPLAFELRYNAGEVHTKLALAIASMWKEALGVDVRLTQVEFKSLLQDIDRGDVEMFRSSWVGDYNDAYTFAQYLKSDFGVNLPHYSSPQLRRAAAQRGRGSRSTLRAPRAARGGRARDARTITRCCRSTSTSTSTS